MEDINRTKTIVYVILGILILGVIGFLAYYYLFPAAGILPRERERVTGRVPGGLPVTGEREEKKPEELKPGEEIEVPEATLTRLTDFAVISPTLNKAEDKILFYKKDGGDLLSSDFSGKTQEKVSNITIIGMLNAFWSPARDRAAVFYLDGENLKGFLHIGTSTVSLLPQNVAGFAWSPDGKLLSYLREKGGGLELVTADSAGKSQRVILETAFSRARLAWVSSDRIALETPASALIRNFVFVFSRSSGSFRKILGPAFGLTSLWSPDGTKILTSSTRSQKLALYDSAGKFVRDLPAQTLSEKCAWSGKSTLVCALPRGLPEAVLPDAYFRGEISTEDKLVRLDTDKGLVETVFDEGNFDISDLVLTRDGGNVFFVDRKDGTLWRLRLK